MDDPSITRWIHELKDGDDVAAEKLWGEYFHRIVALGKRRVQRNYARARDEEDVALSAINAVFAGAKEGRYPDLADREGLWRLFAAIATNKAKNLVRDEGRRAADRMDARPVEEHTAQTAEGEDGSLFESLSLTSAELIDLLEPKLQNVAVFKLEGHQNEEIARRIERSVSTVERYLQMIRHRWQKFAESD